MLGTLFGTSDAEGSMMAGATEEGLGDPQQVALSVSILARNLLDSLARGMSQTIRRADHDSPNLGE